MLKNNQPTDDTQKPQGSFSSISVEDTLPPMITTNTTTVAQSTVKQDVVNPSPADNTRVSTSNGSAAPNDDLVMPQVIGTTAPKKKFAGGRVIATILGLFLLVGGAGAGVFLVQQNQNINEEAAGSCGQYLERSDCIGKCSGDGYECKWHTGSENCGKGTTQCGESGGGDVAPITKNCTSDPDCTEGSPSDFYYCADVNATYVKCSCKSECYLDSYVSDKGGCQYFCGITYGGINCRTTEAYSYGETCEGDNSCNETTVYFDGKGTCIHAGAGGVPDGLCALYPGCLGDDSGGGTSGCEYTCDSNSCTITKGYNNANCYVNKYRCDGIDTPCPNSSSPDSERTPIVGQASSASFSNNLCNKVEQIDVYAGTEHDNSVTKIFPPCETEPPVDKTALCSSIKAYNTSWVLLTSTQLSALKVGDSVNFCVNGVTNSGSFDKGRFTINSVLQSETTTKRPNSNDFCQNYLIPSNVTTFNVTAQIHHITLGWK